MESEMFAENKLTDDMNEVFDFLKREREKVLSEAEWKFRMRGYGYRIKRVEDGLEVSKLPQMNVLGVLNA